MSGMLLAEYILRERRATNTMPPNPALVTTVVTTNLARAITNAYDVKMIEVLTGFKYIGEQIKFFEQNHTYQYVFGLEESYGCLAGTHARDKDAIVSVMCLAEIAAFCKEKGQSLWDMMLSMYEKYGYYKEEQFTITLKGVDGAKEMTAIMNKLRENPPETFGDYPVLEFRDYQTDRRINMQTKQETTTGLPTSNVLYFELPDEAWCCVRPSGTEPKIKFYMGIKGTSLEDAQQKVEELTQLVRAIL
jgi:phosphoglucomutase